MKTLCYVKEAKGRPKRLRVSNLIHMKFPDENTAAGWSLVLGDKEDGEWLLGSRDPCWGR